MKYFLIMVMMFLAGCTQQERAFHWGGTADIEIPKTYKFAESASWGVMEGSVILKETFNANTTKKESVQEFIIVDSTIGKVVK